MAFFDFLRLVNAWKRKATEIEVALAQEQDPVKRAELLATQRALQFCSSELHETLNIKDAEEVAPRTMRA